MLSVILLMFFYVANGVLVPIPDFEPEESVRQVLGRLPPWISNVFDSIEVLRPGRLVPGKVRVEVDEAGRKTVYAASAVDALYGINMFLRQNCFTQITWTNSSFSGGCPPMESLIFQYESPKIRYFGNMCTYSYSSPWWGWQQWELFIDWLALNGFNTVLMPLGQEAVWHDVFASFGVPGEDLHRYFTSPSYTAWHRMGNLKGWKGGSSDALLRQELQLAQRIVARLRELGIVPILPMFSGFVPESIAQIFPKARFVRNSCWNDFNSTYSCLLSVAPNDPLFKRIGTAFLQAQSAAFGDSTHLYSADPFNELKPSQDKKELADAASAISSTCREFDPDCVWVTQSWQFTYKKWPSWAVKSFLSAVPVGHLLILDLHAEVEPAWRKFSSFYGHNFVWCLLHNFGGTRELRGNLKAVNKGYQLALATQPNMVGAGLSMEAIDQNYVVYQFAIDRFWSKNMISVPEWIDTYADSRYGGTHQSVRKVWSQLAQTLYDEPLTSSRSTVFLYHRPGFGGKITYWFPSGALHRIALQFSYLKSHLWKNPLFREDMKDVLRTSIQLRMSEEHVLKIYEAYALDDKLQVGASCSNLLESFAELELYANVRMGDWIASARAIGNTAAEKDQLEGNARDLLTTWGPDGQNLDYAHREWSGLFLEYYAQRWSFFCDWLIRSERFNASAYDQAIFNAIEKNYTEKR
ncbi:unnamed protein product [Caenorhabditis auriculariae]|uniref:Alpha-N-acetylglucosaminidase n=1 Tax=Caenorhabditis auriculariae TaxID=2777116 RepID=A0A8S1HXK9_9PELO|nr:unnamed protein product [Caenorhabditis auriculariae]